MFNKPRSAPRAPSFLPVLTGLAALGLLLFACAPVLEGLASAWQTEEYSHGFLIPIIAFFIGWHRLTEKKPEVSPSWWGVIVLTLAAALILTGRLSAFEPPSQYGLLLALVGLSLAMLGTAATRVLAPAFVYLIFAIPLPRLIYVGLSQDLQLLSSTLGAWPLDVLGIPVFQDGNVIDLGGVKLQVVEACNGLRYLFPLMSFGYLIAYLLQDKMWKRIVIFLSTIPITIIMNALRIAFIGVTVNLWGRKMAGGFLHDFEGWSLFLVCILVLMGEVWILQRVGARGRFRYEYFGLARGALINGRMKIASPTIAALIVAALMAGLLGTHVIDERAEITPSHPPFDSFDLQIGEWHGQPDRLDPEVLQALQLSDYWFGNYQRGRNEPPVNFYMAYYASQRVGASAHSPSNCIPGGGWEIVNNRTKTITLPAGKSLTVSRLLIKKDEASELVYYWFDERGRDLTEQYGAKWYLLWDSIFMHRTDGAMVRAVTTIGNGETEAAAEKRLNDFLGAVYSKINAFVPGGK